MLHYTRWGFSQQGICCVLSCSCGVAGMPQKVIVGLSTAMGCWLS